MLVLELVKTTGGDEVSLFQAIGGMGIVGLVEAVKVMFPRLSSRVFPVLNMVFGVVLTVLLGGALSGAAVLTGIFVGLSAGGLFSGAMVIKSRTKGMK
jgi:hypothetical protein